MRNFLNLGILIFYLILIFVAMSGMNLIKLYVFLIRIFSHPNILPVIGCCNAPPDLVVITQYMPFGSLYNVLHQSTNVVVDSTQALKFALDIARGMAYFHNLERFVPNFYLNSYHVMVN